MMKLTRKDVREMIAMLDAGEVGLVREILEAGLEPVVKPTPRPGKKKTSGKPGKPA